MKGGIVIRKFLELGIRDQRLEHPGGFLDITVKRETPVSWKERCSRRLVFGMLAKMCCPLDKGRAQFVVSLAFLIGIFQL